MPIQVLINRVVLLAIARCAHFNRPNEAGGILVGYRNQYGLHIIDITQPAPRDRATPVRFERRDNKHQKFATLNWRRSGQKVDWLGDWHSHPQSIVKPSRVDIRTWKRQVKETRKPMVFVIQGFHEPSIFLATGVNSAACELAMKEETDEHVLFGAKTN